MFVIARIERTLQGFHRRARVISSSGLTDVETVVDLQPFAPLPVRSTASLQIAASTW